MQVGYLDKVDRARHNLRLDRQNLDICRFAIQLVEELQTEQDDNFCRTTFLSISFSSSVGSRGAVKPPGIDISNLFREKLKLNWTKVISCNGYANVNGVSNENGGCYLD